ncbi:PH domain-containing protein [Myroides sp. WP-1]|uniref:PH domain-containing protein n=1 Tax=Myroides sp. WP-1 TaxID=2759944 RepID=UPI0015FA6EFF|nr:PH domain-containing protein [Myroides sp. WP-1]MBB1139321.1 PH domain-containing protein [Myroides sp. WP-1]
METTFSNQQINSKTLPQLEEVVYEPLHSKYKNVVLITTVVMVLVIGAIGACGFYLPLEKEALLVEYKTTVLGISIVWAIATAILRIAGVAKKGYAVRAHDISYKTGLINQKQITIPFNRVQHVEIYEGFLLRLFGLCQIEFFTAGGNFGDLKIPGLPLKEADRIKAFVIEQISPVISEAQVNDPEINPNTAE